MDPATWTQQRNVIVNHLQIFRHSMQQIRPQHNLVFHFLPGQYNHNYISSQACNGCEGKDDYGDYYDGEEYKGVNVHAGSLIVNPGCTFTGWSGDNYDGNKQQFNAGE